MFQPPYCPNRLCPAHRNPAPGWYTGHGSYRVACRPHPIPRFRCKRCRRSFSRQTFRADRYDHRPDLNSRLLELLTSGVGLRQSARTLGLSRRCTELKARKLARHLRRLNLNLRGPLPDFAELQLDEFESYETSRLTRPLSIPFVIEATSGYIIWAESAKIRPRGRMSQARYAAIARDELRFGRRRGNSRRSVVRSLRRALALTADMTTIRIATDKKTSYPRAIREVFGERLVVHTRTNSREPRTTANPLFPIHLTEAFARDLMGRLRRHSWLVSKRRRWLDCALHVFLAYRNLVRRWRNRSEESPAQLLGFVPRRLTFQELVSWRQDSERRSLHPLTRSARTIEEFERARRRRT